MLESLRDDIRLIRQQHAAKSGISSWSVPPARIETHSILPTRPRKTRLTRLFRGDKRVEMSISIFDHDSGEYGGVRDESGIQCIDDTSDGWSSGVGVNGVVCRNTSMSPADIPDA